MTNKIKGYAVIEGIASYVSGRIIKTKSGKEASELEMTVITADDTKNKIYFPSLIPIENGDYIKVFIKSDDITQRNAERIDKIKNNRVAASYSSYMVK